MRGINATVNSTRIAQNGYHYTKTRAGWTLTHRLIAEEQILKRPLRKGERVVFKDGNKTNLDPSNLKVTTIRSDLQTLRRQRRNLTARIEELQGQLADLDDVIHRRENQLSSSDIDSL